MFAALCWRREGFREWLARAQRKFVRNSGRALRRGRGPLEMVARIADAAYGDDRLHVARRVLFCDFAPGLDSARRPNRPPDAAEVAAGARADIVLRLYHSPGSECNLPFFVAQGRPRPLQTGVARRLRFSLRLRLWVSPRFPGKYSRARSCASGTASSINPPQAKRRPQAPGRGVAGKEFILAALALYAPRKYG